MKNRNPLLLKPGRALTWTQARAGDRKSSAAEATFLIHNEIGFEGGVTSGDVLTALAEIGSTATIHLQINSPGGLAFHGIAIYNAFRNHKGKVTASVDGAAGSAASVIAMAASEITMQRGSIIFIHNAQALTIGDQHAHKETAGDLTKISADMAEIYSERSGVPLREVQRMMDRETTMSAREAVAMGFADALGWEETGTTSLHKTATMRNDRWQRQLARNQTAI